MIVTEIVQIGSIVLLTVTLWITILTYRRNKKMELQNQLYKIKLEAFANIVYEIEQFSNKADKMIRIIQEMADRNQRDLSRSKIFEMADDIDEELYRCNAIIIKNSVYFSPDSSELLTKFAGNIFGKTHFQTSKNWELYFDEYYTNQLDLANQAVEKIRKELELESLNKSLFGRVR